MDSVTEYFAVRTRNLLLEYMTLFEGRDLYYLLARSQNSEQRLLASLCLSARPSVAVSMEQFGSRWTNFDEI